MDEDPSPCVYCIWEIDTIPYNPRDGFNPERMYIQTEVDSGIYNDYKRGSGGVTHYVQDTYNDVVYRDSMQRAMKAHCLRILRDSAPHLEHLIGGTIAYDEYGMIYNPYLEFRKVESCRMVDANRQADEQYK
jgi:hypothetical protein